MPVRAGDRFRLELPCSEVCMHMHVAGKVMTVEVIRGRHSDGRPSFAAQLYGDNGQPFSIPILTAEAGIYGYGDDMFYYAARESAEDLHRGLPG
jgi:hypothetical protein